MKDIFVICSKEDKNISKKLVSKLEAAGYSCYALPRDSSAGSPEELIRKSKIAVLVLSPSAEKSKDVFSQLETAAENNSFIIPFKAGKIENNLGMIYMLTELDWVDAYGDGFDEAFEVLLEILEETGERKPAKVKSKLKSASGKDSDASKKYLYGIIGILTLALIYFVFLRTPEKPETPGLKSNTTATGKKNTIPDIAGKELSKEETKIVGYWRMADYEDSRKMTPEEKKLTEQNIEIMKSKVLLTFNKDRSFIREGFTPQPQKGYWEYDADKKKIYLIPEGTDKKEEINIINLTENEMTFVVTESVEINPGNTEIVTTKLTFRKQQ
ncbi:MAG: TIR domain-containing protein [Chlorobi bacterium]|nr:TIR domain-containing protein [Chlorobiota bacterium]